MPAKSPEPPKITLKFGGQKATGSASMSVDNESLKRQQELVRAGANGYAPGKGNKHNTSVSQHLLIPTLSLRINAKPRSKSTVS